MYKLYFISLIGLLLILPIYIVSLRYDYDSPKNWIKKKGILGIISGWGYFCFLIGLWIAPQPKIYSSKEIGIFLRIFLSLPFIASSCYLGIKGVIDLGLETSETHISKKLIVNGIYRRIRHPQYLGAMLAHVGFSILLNGLYSMLTSPVILVYLYIIAKQEEKVLELAFNGEYQKYKERTGMFLSMPIVFKK